MVSPDGSAAVAVKATPESANIEARRQYLVAHLPRQLDRLDNALRYARGAITGPDPEAALGYLAVMRDRLAEVLADHS